MFICVVGVFFKSQLMRNNISYKNENPGALTSDRRWIKSSGIVWLKEL